MEDNQVVTYKMGSFDVCQRLEDGYFEAGLLIRQWNSVKGNPKRRVSEFLNSPKTKEFIEALLEDMSQVGETDNGDIQTVIHIKGGSSKNGKIADEWYMHPYLFIKFAMWINPRFEVQVIKFIYEELTKNKRLHEESRNSLVLSVATIPNSDYKQVVTAMQWIVFNKTGDGLRKSATKEQLYEIYELERSLSFLINTGLVKTNEQLMSAMRKIYSDKYRGLHRHI